MCNKIQGQHKAGVGGGVEREGRGSDNKRLMNKDNDRGTYYLRVNKSRVFRKNHAGRNAGGAIP